MSKRRGDDTYMELLQQGKDVTLNAQDSARKMRLQKVQTKTSNDKEDYMGIILVNFQ